MGATTGPGACSPRAGERRPDLILGSASPRRRDLLAQIGVVPAEIRPADIDETPAKDELPRAYVERMAREKCAALAAGTPTPAKGEGPVILTADTVVSVGRRILGKPADAAEAEAFLRLLSGRRHRVTTAICVARGDTVRCRLVETRVRFKRLSDTEITDYLASGEWQGKAGGYAIQGIAGAFIPAINGSYSNVVGLPLTETAGMLAGLGYPVSYRGMRPMRHPRRRDSWPFRSLPAAGMLAQTSRPAAPMKGRIILVDMPKEPRASQAALLIDGRLEDLLIDPRKGDDRPIPGEIYRAKVVRIVPNIGGAFVKLTPKHMGYLRETKGVQGWGDSQRSGCVVSRARKGFPRDDATALQGFSPDLHARFAGNQRLASDKGPGRAEPPDRNPALTYRSGAERSPRTMDRLTRCFWTPSNPADSSCVRPAEGARADELTAELARVVARAVPTSRRHRSWAAVERPSVGIRSFHQGMVQSPARPNPCREGSFQGSFQD